MQHIELRPDLKTSGGEVCDIMVEGRFAGTLTLVYREGDRIAGSAQIEQEAVKPNMKDQVVSYLQHYIQFLIQAMRAETCDVLVTYSSYDRVVTTAPEDEFAPEMEEPVRQQEFEDPEEYWAEAEYDLVTVSERKNKITYHVYDMEKNWVAEVTLRTDDPDVTGRVRWIREPADEEIELITELVVSDFDETTVDSFVFHHHFENELLDTIELTHEDLLDTPVEHIGKDMDEEISVLLARDDGDVLTYEIYKQSFGSLPVGTATVDIESRRLTGFIDFRERGSIEDADAITSHLLRELDKEKEFDGLNLSLMYKNELIEEIVVDNESVH
ncbi:hypothetical protein AB6A23_12320 [Paenibacillus tarimensis]